MVSTDPWAPTRHVRPTGAASRVASSSGVGTRADGDTPGPAGSCALITIRSASSAAAAPPIVSATTVDVLLLQPPGHERVDEAFDLARIARSVAPGALTRPARRRTERIRGELLKLGIAVSNRLIRRYRRRGRHRPSGQSWRTFLVNHRPSIWAADLLTVQTLTFRTLDVLLFVAHGRRELVHLAVTAHPTAAWVWRQLINATPWGHAPAYLVRDRDAVYSVDVARRAAGLGIRMLLTPVRAPRANAVCERFLGSARRECIDHALILSERQLRRVLTEYVAYFNRSRPHRGIGQRTPQAAPTKVSRGRGVARDGVIAVPVLSGLHHEYRAAARPRLGWPGEPEQPDKRPASR